MTTNKFLTLIIVILLLLGTVFGTLLATGVITVDGVSNSSYSNNTNDSNDSEQVVDGGDYECNICGCKPAAYECKECSECASCTTIDAECTTCANTSYCPTCQAPPAGLHVTDILHASLKGHDFVKFDGYTAQLIPSKYELGDLYHVLQDMFALSRFVEMFNENGVMLGEKLFENEEIPFNFTFQTSVLMEQRYREVTWEEELWITMCIFWCHYCEIEVCCCADMSPYCNREFMYCREQFAGTISHTQIMWYEVATNIAVTVMFNTPSSFGRIGISVLNDFVLVIFESDDVILIVGNMDYLAFALEMNSHSGDSYIWEADLDSYLLHGEVAILIMQNSLNTPDGNRAPPSPIELILMNFANGQTQV